jgi:hypothetical protein
VVALRPLGRRIPGEERETAEDVCAPLDEDVVVVFELATDPIVFAVPMG